MSWNKRTTHVIDALFLLHILLTAYRVPRSQLLRQLALLHISLTAYRVPRSQLLRQLALLYISLTAYRVPRSRLLKLIKTTCTLVSLSITAYRVAGYAEVSSSGRVFCSYSLGAEKKSKQITQTNRQITHAKEKKKRSLNSLYNWQQCFTECALPNSLTLFWTEACQLRWYLKCLTYVKVIGMISAAPTSIPASPKAFLSTSCAVNKYLSKWMPWLKYSIRRMQFFGYRGSFTNCRRYQGQKYKREFTNFDDKFISWDNLCREKFVLSLSA